MKTETRRAVLVAIALFVILLTAGAIATVAETRDLLRPGPLHDSRTDPLRLQSSQTPPPFRYELASDGRPTGRFVFQDFFVPVAWTGSAERPPVALGSAQDFFSGAIRIVGGAVFDTIRTGIVAVFDFVSGDASAACTGGSCFWIGGTGNFSDTTHWSTTSGGAACSCIPAATDTVTFDASSGAGTATQNNVTFTSGAVDMTSSSVAVSGSSNTWKVGGNFSDANGHLAGASALFEFTSSATLALATGATVGSITIDNGITLTLGGGGTNFVVSTTLTLGTSAAATLALGGSTLFLKRNTGTQFSPNASSTASGSGTLVWRDDTSGGTQTIPGFNYGAWGITTSDNSASVTRTIGSVTTTGACSLTMNTGSGFTQTNQLGSSTLTCGSLTLGSNSTVVLTSGANSTVVISGNVAVNAAADYITSPTSGSWTVSGSWANLSTSASWSFAAPIAFTSSTSRTMTFCGGNCGTGGGFEFTGTVAFDGNTAGSVTWTLGNSILTTNAIFIGDRPGGGFASTNTLDVSTSNFTITAGGLQLGISGIGILNARTSTITVQNSAQDTGVVFIGDPGYVLMSHSTWTIISTDPLPWDDESAATGVVGNQSLPSLWDPGTSSVTVQDTNANAQIGFLGKTGTSLFSGYNVFYDLTVQGGSTTLGITASLRLAHNLQVSAPSTLTVSGSVSTGPLCCLVQNPNMAIAGGDVTVSGTLSVGATNTLSIGGNLSTAPNGLSITPTSTTILADAGGTLGSFTPSHTVDVLGADLGQLVANGSTSVYFKSSFKTEALTVSQPILFAFESSSQAVRWTWNTTSAISSPNAYLFLKSDYNGPNGDLCHGQWYLDEPQGGISASLVAVCGSIAQYFVRATTNDHDLGLNVSWIFSDSGSGYAFVAKCSLQYIFLGVWLHCQSLVPAGASLPVWLVNGQRVGSGQTLDLYLAWPFPWNGSVTVTCAFLTPDPVSRTPTWTWTGTIDSTPNGLAYIAIVVLVLILIRPAARRPRRKSDRFDVRTLRMLPYRAIAIHRIDRKNSVKYELRSLRSFRRSTLRSRRFRVRGIRLIVIRGRLKRGDGLWTYAIIEGKGKG